jgi:PAS domain S-box-containing protein
MGSSVPFELQPAGQERFLALLEAVPDAIVALNRAGRIVFANQQTEHLFGFSREELLGRPLEMLLPERLKGIHARHREAYFAEPRTRPMGSGLELTARRKDGHEFPVEVSLSPVPNDEGLWVISTVRDITERKRAEQKIQQLHAELEQRVIERTTELEAANEDLKAFIYSVSHDLRMPLASIDSFASMALDDAGLLPAATRRYLELIRQGTLHMEALITGLLDLSRLSRQPLQKERVRMRELVAQALETLNGHTQRPNLTIHVGPLPDAEADPVLLKQVWINLLSNAVKYTRQRESARVDIGATTSRGATTYYVRDNGVGFDPQQAERLFGVFQRLHGEEEYEGTGVGLAIVQRIVRRHGGRVWAEAKVGEGATFYFTLGTLGDLQGVWKGK